MSRTRVGVFAPFAATLVVSLALVGPAAAEPADGMGQEMSSASHDKSASGEANASEAHRSSVGEAHSADAGAKSARGDSGAEEESPSGEDGVQLERPNDYQAQADPDGMENGGVDQPGGEGGVDETDQDGNNGSGNDSDCEDDNRGVGVPGHCKNKSETEALPEKAATDAAPEAEVLGVQAMTDGAVPAEVAGTEAVAPAEAQVLGVQQTAAPSAGILPQTGSAAYLTLVGLAGLALAAAGALTMLFRRRVQHSR